MTEGPRRQIARLGTATGAADPRVARRAVIGSWAAMVGAMILARMRSDPELSEEALAQTRAWIARDAAPVSVGQGR